MLLIEYPMAFTVSIVIMFSFSQLCFSYPTQLKKLNDRPIIGVLSQELTNSMKKNFAGNYTSYIAASYVKFLEAAGARVVPIWINQKEEYYKHMIHSLNGILFPGGTAMLEGSGYGDAGRLLYDLATSLNNNGDYFPLWGTCLGFELITFLAAKNDIRTSCSGMDLALPLKFKEGYLDSKLFGRATDNILSLLAKKNLTSNFHIFCVTEKAFALHGLGNQYQILAISKDSKNKPFIAAIEGKTLPFYGVQFHPEKNSYEWNINSHNIPHSADATRVGQYFAEFFVNEARKNGHKFSSLEEEANYLIYNHHTYYTGSKGISFAECYFFTE